MEKENLYNQILEEAKNDDNIIGLFLKGSRGKGFENGKSDYDIKIIVKDEVAEEYKTKYSNIDNPDIDLSVQSLSEFREYAEWGTDFAWDRYDFARVKAIIDKTGEIQNLIDSKGTIPEDEWKKFTGERIDDYLNGVFRSVKCIRSGNLLGAHIESASSIPNLIITLFALHKRLAPFYGYLPKELEVAPLEKLPISNKELLDKISKVLKNADLETQQELLKMVEELAIKEGFGKVFDSWKGKDKWAMEFHP
ncbi:MAG: hypothetical protein WCV59_02400 [Parcubacteria group bacterium]|jgi:hypothetical protein